MGRREIPEVERRQPRTDSLTRTYTRFVAGSVALTGFSLMGGVLTDHMRKAGEAAGAGITAREIGLVAVGIAAVGLLSLVAHRALQRRDSQIASIAEQQGEYIDRLPEQRVPYAIFCYAALSLFLELAVIRWHGAAMSVLAFYKNYSLLAVFAGLGLGYALSRRRSIPLFFVIPILGIQLTLLWILRTTPYAGGLQALQLNPFTEQLTMGLSGTQSPLETAAVYLMLGSVFLFTALAFLPIGQVVGRMMDRTNYLRAYGLNLLGSLVGVGLMNVVSFLWTPPAVWFGIGFASLIPLLMFSSKVASVSAAGGLMVIAVIALPANREVQEVHSPYQLLEREQSQSGDMVIRAAGHFLLTASDYRPESVANDPAAAAIADYYEFPFRVAPTTQNVLVVGAGAGNDVAAALRVGVGHIDAVEIDPAVVALGRAGHPERPFSNVKVSVIVDDARSYLETTSDTYDLIVYGLLDSHSVLSHGASVRLDSFVYTVQGLRAARSRLSNGGVLSLSFFAFTQDLTGKLYAMLTETFDGVPPRVISSPGAVLYLHGSDGPPLVPDDRLRAAGLVDITSIVAGLSGDTDLATDDWPFLYMPRRVYPFSYLGVFALVGVLSAFLIRGFLSEGLVVGNGGFFFLGAGFLLIEAKGITELGLAFGNTWQVVGLVIAGILLMAYLANMVVVRVGRIRLEVVFLCLLGSIGLGYVVTTNGVALSGAGKWLALLVLTVPIFFSGMAFSIGLKLAANLSGVMAANLSGAIFGGLLEYNSMRFGFKSLYLFAAALYVLAGWILVRESHRSINNRTPESRVFISNRGVTSTDPASG